MTKSNLICNFIVFIFALAATIIHAIMGSLVSAICYSFVTGMYFSVWLYLIINVILDRREKK